MAGTGNGKHSAQNSTVTSFFPFDVYFSSKFNTDTGSNSDTFTNLNLASVAHAAETGLHDLSV